MQKELAISVFNFHGINPVEADEYDALIYKNIPKVKIRKENEFKEVEGEIEMETTIRKKDVLVLEQEKIQKEIEEVKQKQAELNEPDVAKYNRAIEAENKTATQKNIITEYESYQKSMRLLEKLSYELSQLTPFIVGIDCGKYNTKYAYTIDNETLERGLFASKVERVSECPYDSGVKFFVDDEIYAMLNAKRVSEEDIIRNLDIAPMPNTKAHEYHRVLMLKALYKIYLETGRRVFNVVVGASLDSYKEDEGARVYLSMLNEELPQEVQEQLKNTHDIKEQHLIYKQYAQKVKNRFEAKSFTVRESGKEAVTLIINDLHVAPESVTGATKVDYDDLLHAYIGDLGGLNDSFIPVVQYAPIFEHIISNKNGMMDKYRKIAQWLETKSSDCTIADRTNIEVLLNNRHLMDASLEALIKEAIFDILTKMINKLMQNNIPFQPGITSLVFIGGGAQVLAPYIKEFFTEKVDLKGKLYIAEEDGIYSNVFGMFDAGVNYFDQRDFEKKKFLTSAS